MVNNYRKGKRRQRQARDFLQERGWKVELQKSSRNSPNDFFGEFDLIAIQKGKKPLFAQVKSNEFSQVSEILTFSENNLPLEYCNVWLMAFFDYQGFAIKKIKDGEWIKFHDER